ncbi:MAG: terminase large subunit, partial [Bacillota bacterium]
GSVEYRMKWLQSLDAIVIDPERCPDTVKEFSEYEYERDPKTNDVLEGYPDINNHHIDAVSYGTFSIWRRRGQ